ncbi:TauD/TfdA family dioxygenase [Novosphingobium sp. G106]|uniref:TauD/TfdA dioxygenase family protein n=1 Tax=Novosphingobium sp. G106 TaxID=2849500 RepID=UPI001C2D8647|nr:TauD/TfdA family dioxygenase [Novosphingobium sp. G106]MBV1688915.1 TauD/TfdA family dioxygenase [Novosphingobium sp. G106]
MEIRRLQGPFGAVASDADIGKADDKTISRLVEALYDNQILVISGQSLSDAEYVRFGNHWGQPLEFFAASRRRNDFPELIKQDNAADTPANVRDGAGHWHSDGTYEEVPASVTMLYGKEAPDKGGETLITSTVLAYEALPDTMKSRIENLVGLHCLSGAPPLEGETFAYIPEEIARLGVHQHPFVMRHPVNGAKALFLSGSAFGIQGMDKSEARALIAELRAHATRPEFRIAYKVMPGDLFLWDNFSTMHRATPIEYSDEPGKRRLLYRISTRGMPSSIQSRKPA